MKREVKVSVIVPTYNDEKYIDRCIQSILNQTLEEIEIIIVNDGSTDSTYEILERYAEMYPDKVIVRHKENEGQGMARNLGISIARGEYIGFVDSDDYIDIEMYETMYNVALEEKSDVVCCDFIQITVETQKQIYVKQFPTSSNDIEFYLKNLNVASTPVDKIYKREFFFKFSFEKIKFEDIALIPVILSFCTKISYIAQPFYFYCRRPNSTSTSTNDIGMLDIITAFEKVMINTNPIYINEIVRYVSGALLWNLKHRTMYKAEFIELINNHKILFLENNYIQQSLNKSEIYQFIDKEVIPKTIYYNDFDNLTEEYQLENMSTWSKYTKDFEIIGLNESNCIISTAPNCVKEAFNQGDYKFVGDYYKIKKIYEHGGIAVDKNIRFTSPIGDIRAEEIFFTFLDDRNISDLIFGSLPGKDVIGKLLESYERNLEYTNKIDLLSVRIQDLLYYHHHLFLDGFTQHLSDFIKVYRADYLLFPTGSQNCATLHLNCSTELNERGLSVVSIEFIKYLSTKMSLYYQNSIKTYNNATESNFQNNKTLEEAYRELERVKNSRSWKITKPLRQFLNLFRKNKYSKEEME